MKFNSAILFLFFLVIFVHGKSQTITIGTGVYYNSSSSYPAPYGNWYWGARHQFIIRASEINAAGVNGAKYINSLAFNVLLPTGTSLNNFQIKLSNSKLAAFTYPANSSTFQSSGFTTVFGPTSYKDVSGWNTHNFAYPFYWDGTSNIIVEICFNNANYTQNAMTYYSNLTFNGSAYRYADANNNCTNVATSVSYKRPNMRLGFISPVPPTASFVTNDSIYVNTPYTFVNNSTRFYSSYWNIKPITANRFCNIYGCFIDSNTNLDYTFSSTGTYQILLVVKGFFGVDSIKKTLYVNDFYRLPKANFYTSTQNTIAPEQVFFYDSSLYGVNGWQWSINPPCNGCATNPYQYPNTFSPSANAQNPNFYAMDAGVFDVCLKVWNDLGADSICKQKYLTIAQSYLMCNGNDSLSSLSSAYIYDIGGPDQNYQIGLIGQCNSGFVINPSTCADSIILYVDRFKLRTNDTIQIRDGETSTSPLIKKITGANLPLSSKMFVARSGKMFLRMTTGYGYTTSGDSGFVFHWETKNAAKIFSLGNFVCGGDSLKIYTSQSASAGRTFLWKLNGQNIPANTDSFYYAKYQGIYSLIVSATGCSDTNFVFISESAKPIAKFSVNSQMQCLNNNNFLFTDSTQFNSGNYSRNWNFGDGTSSGNTTFNKTYSATGTFLVMLTTTSYKGCKDSAFQFIRVAGTPASSIIFSGANNVCQNDSVSLTSATLNASKYQWYLNNVSLPADTFSSYFAKTAGLYNLKVTNNFGCDSMSDAKIVTFKTLPSKPVITRSLDTLKYFTQNEIRWYLNNQIIANADKNFYLPTVKGKYSVEVDSNDCKNYSDQYDFYFTDINLINASNNFLHIYPNPASTLINATSDLSFNFIITDVNGRIILSSKASSNTFKIDINTLSKGMYFLKAFNAEKISITRFEKL